MTMVPPPGSDGPPTSQNAESATAITDRELKAKSQELGLIGRLFGSRESAPISIAGGLALFCLLAMIVAPMLPTKAYGFSISDLEKTSGSLVLASITFLGGYLGGGKQGS